MRLQKIPSICGVISTCQVSPAEVSDTVWQCSYCILLSILHSADMLCRVLFLLTGPDIWPRTRLWFCACLKSEGDVALGADTWCSSWPSICPHCLERTFLSSLVNSMTWSSLSSGNPASGLLNRRRVYWSRSGSAHWTQAKLANRKSGFLVCRALLLRSEWNLLCLLSREGN